MFWWWAAALAADLWDANPGTGRDPVLVVTTPGFALPAYLPLVNGLAAQGRDVRVARFGCGEQDTAALADELVAAASALPEGFDVVAHGVGAVLALRSADRLAADRYVLLAPVLDVQPVASLSWLAGLEIGASAVLSTPGEWRGRDVASLLLGEGAHLGCAPAPFAREVQGWVRAGEVPLSLERVERPVWVAVSLGDSVAAVEAVIPASRSLPLRDVARLGINRLDEKDFSHGEMLWHPTPVAAALAELAR